jgi:2-polyprenyl-3-methyl-5-hydroxy-6-metoxy-1,4-benzoquinol methylase
MGVIDVGERDAGWQERVRADQLSSTVFGAEHFARYVFAAHWAPARRVLDLCCGCGYGTHLLGAAGASEAVGLDISPRAISEARRRYAKGSARFIQCDVTHTLPIESAELVVCFEGIEHLADPEALLARVRESTVPDGVFIVSTPNASRSVGGHSGNPHHRREYTRAAFTSMLARYFGEVRLFFQWRAGDPYDASWTVRRLLSAGLPVGLKSWLRARYSTLPPATGIDEAFKFSSYEYRPLPASYLRTLPGLRYEAPHIWIAVCRGPARQ